MSSTKVFQMDARLAKPPELTKTGDTTRCVIVAISNEYWKDSSEQKQEFTNSLRWVSWGAAAENHAKYLTTGSHVNIIGSLRNNPPKKEGDEYIMSLTADEVHYLDSKEATETLRAKHSK